MYYFIFGTGAIPSLSPSIQELRLPLPPPSLATVSPPSLHTFEALSNRYVLPFSKSSPVSTVTSEETSETDEHAVHSSEDTLSIKSAFQQVKSSKDKCSPPGKRIRLDRCTPPDKRIRLEPCDSTSPVDLRSESSSPSSSRDSHTDKQIKAKPKVWRPY